MRDRLRYCRQLDRDSIPAAISERLPTSVRQFRVLGSRQAEVRRSWAPRRHKAPTGINTLRVETPLWDKGHSGWGLPPKQHGNRAPAGGLGGPQAGASPSGNKPAYESRRVSARRRLARIPFQPPANRGYLDSVTIAVMGPDLHGGCPGLTLQTVKERESSVEQQSTAADEEQPYLSLIIPAYNESARLGSTLRAINAYLSSQPYTWEVIVVDDGSTDDTLAIARAVARQCPCVTVVTNPHRGKAYTVRSGIGRGRGRIIGFTDADLATPIETLEKVLPRFAEGYDVVIGSREGQGAVRQDEPFYRHLMGRVFNALVQLLALPGIQDSQCGFKILRGPVAHELFGALLLYGEDAHPPSGPAVTAFDVELLYLARRRGYRIATVPVAWQYVADSKVDPVRDAFRNFRDVVLVRYNALRGRYPTRRR